MVIAIVAILASLLLPALDRAREQANRVVCASQLRQMTQGTTMYAIDSDDYLPTRSGRFRHNWGGGIPEVASMFELWSEDLDKYNSWVANRTSLEYLEDYSMMVCPSLSYRDATKKYLNKEWWTPGHYRPHGIVSSYEAPGISGEYHNGGKYMVQLSKHNPKTPLLVDRVVSPGAEGSGSWSQYKWSTHFDGYQSMGGNTSYPDGRVEWQSGWRMKDGWSQGQCVWPVRSPYPEFAKKYPHKQNTGYLGLCQLHTTHSQYWRRNDGTFYYFKRAPWVGKGPLRGAAWHE